MVRKTLLPALILMLGTDSFSATSTPFEDKHALEEYNRVVLVGCRLGTGTGSEALPTFLAMQFTGTYASTKLDKTVKLYVEWVLDTDVSPTAQQYTPPLAIDDAEFAEWFGDGSDLQVSLVGQHFGGRYKACPEGSGLASPTLSSYPLNSDGELTLQDRFGGVGDETILIMTSEFGDGEHVGLYMGWDRPSTWFDDLEAESLNFYPGDVWYRALNYGDLVTYVPIHIVEWVSADIANMTGSSEGASPRDIDASDVSTWCQFSTGAVRWGFETGESPTESPTWQVDFVPLGASQGNNDASEISAIASLLGQTCTSGKPTEEGITEARAIMEWFGYGLTGRYVAIDTDGYTVPEWDLVDAEQRVLAIANPYGYRDNPNAATVRTTSWSATKRLYR